MPRRTTIFSIWLLVIAPAAHAVDGVIEINQAQALAGGVTASDTAGFPVTLDTRGSYRLTGNLTVPDENTTAIIVGTNFVSIDLNGFIIQGVTLCAGGAGTCSPLGTGVGIQGSGRWGVSVRNGVILRMGNVGINLGPQGEVVDVRLQSNGNDGINAGTLSIVRNCSSFANNNAGIEVYSDSLVSDNVAVKNGGSGIYVSSSGVLVLNNTIQENDGYGIGGLSYGPAYGNNTISGNSSGTVQLGIEINTNLCNGNTTCP